MARWTFVDPVAGTTDKMEVNPESGGSPTRRRRISARRVTAPGADPVRFEGEKQTLRSKAEGTLLSQTAYNMLETAWAKRYYLQVTDDVGRVFQIYLKRLELKPVRSYTYPWKHTFSIEYVVVGGTGV